MAEELAGGKDSLCQRHAQAEAPTQIVNPKVVVELRGRLELGPRDFQVDAMGARLSAWQEKRIVVEVRRRGDDGADARDDRQRLWRPGLRAWDSPRPLVRLRVEREVCPPRV